MNPFERGFPQPDPIEKKRAQPVAEESVESVASGEKSFTQEDFDKLMLWVRHSVEIWKDIEKGLEPALPTDPKEAQSYVDKFEYLKDHNQEKNRDKEGVEFYKRIDAYIGKLKEVK